jgi:4'-phosphopantetheinyl transferase
MSDVWHVPDAMPVADEGRLHVWRFNLRDESADIRRLEPVLRDHELVRADSFHRLRDRTTYVLARAQLRILLGKYLNRDARDVKIAYTANGKPVLSPSANVFPVQFNLAHSQDVALCAVSRYSEVGIDVEYGHAHVDVRRIARRYFSTTEASLLESLPFSEARQWFLRQWTRKEALAKVQGIGLWAVIGCELLSDENARPGEVIVADGPWHIYDLSPGPGYYGAVAHNGAVSRLECFQWPLEWTRAAL